MYQRSNASWLGAYHCWTARQWGGSLHALSHEYWLVATVFFLHLIHGGEIEIGVTFCYKRERHGAVRGLLRCSLLLRTTLPGLSSLLLRWEEGPTIGNGREW